MNILDERYAEMRTELSDYLNDFVLPKQKDMELWIYDSMIKLRNDYDFLLTAKSELHNVLNHVAEHYTKGNHEDVLEDIVKKTKHIGHLESKLPFSKSEKMQAPAFIFVLNYNIDSKLHQEHTFNGDWYKDKSINLKVGTKEAYAELKEIAYLDNAVLINSKGDLLAKKVLLTELDPNKVIKRNGYDKHSSIKMSRALGFRDDHVNARNKNSLAFSEHVYEKDNPVVVYVLSEETGNIRRMVNGVITHSTVHKEINSTPFKDFLESMGEIYVGPLDPRSFNV